VHGLVDGVRGKAGGDGTLEESADTAIAVVAAITSTYIIYTVAALA